MSSVDKVNISGESYDISVSPNGTVDNSSGNFVSGDKSASVTSSYDNVGVVQNTDNHSTIFNKVTRMLYNIRYLYAKLGFTKQIVTGLGNTVVDAINTLKTTVDNKSDKTHTHRFGTNGTIQNSSGTNISLSTSRTSNSDTTLVTSAVTHSIDEDTKISVTPHYEIGYLPSGIIRDNVKIKDLLELILNGYDDSIIATFNSSSDAETYFASHHVHKDFKIGQVIRIKGAPVNNGVNNNIVCSWRIAAINATNGYASSTNNGLTLILEKASNPNNDGTFDTIFKHKWNNSLSPLVPYKNSSVRTFLTKSKTDETSFLYRLNQIFANNTYVELRNPALRMSSQVGLDRIGFQTVTDCENCPDLIVLPSVKHLIGDANVPYLSQHNGDYADSKLPLFNYLIPFYTWTRSAVIENANGGSAYACNHEDNSTGHMFMDHITVAHTIKPLIRIAFKS